MEPTYNDMLLQILTVIGYSKKEEYATKFEEMNRMEAVVNCLEMLPVTIQEQIKAKQIDALEAVKLIPKDLYAQVLTNVSAQALFTMLGQTKTVLTNDQKKKIADIVASY
jgi:hypothetical protein